MHFVNNVRKKILDIVYEDIVKCNKCSLSEFRCQNNYKPALYRGNPEAQIMFVGEALGESEAQQGLPFVGKAGKLLDNMIRSIGLQPEDVYICNVVNDRPPDNRKPVQTEIAACINYLRMQIQIVDPQIIIALGNTATETLLGPGAGVMRRRGLRHKYNIETRYGETNISVYCTFHPAALLRNPAWKALAWDDMQLVKKHMDDWYEWISGVSMPQAENDVI